MKTRGNIAWVWILAVIIGLPSWASAQGKDKEKGGGNAPPNAGPGPKPGGGNPGGGNPGRPNPPPKVDRPAPPPKVDRPAPPKVDRPAPPRVERPAPPKVERPQTPPTAPPQAPKVDRPSASQPRPADRPTPPRVDTPRPTNPGAGAPGLGGLLPGGNPAARPDRDRPERPSARPGDGPGNTVQKPTLPDRPGLTDRPGAGNRPGVADRPNPTRPSINLPNLDGSKPERPSGDRPSVVGRPGDRPNDRDRPERPERPGVGDRPNLDRPSLGDRPNTDRPNLDRPNVDRPGIDRPSVVDRPGIGDRPERPNTDRPDRDRPGIVDRPGVPPRPDVTRPGNNDRDDRDRPGIVDRPGVIPRPDITRPGNNDRDRDRDRDGRPGNDRRYDTDRAVRVERPTAPIFGANHFVNGSINVGGPRFDRSSWGFRGPGPGDRRGDRHDHDDRHHGHHDHNWGNHWHQHYVNHHFHNWYRGPWQGQWSNYSYSPVIWAGARYGVGAWWLYGNWGYGQTYTNPYYVSGSGYDYSQPIIINQYVVDDSAPEALRIEDRPPDEQRALALFDEGLAFFREARYPEAYTRLDAAQRLMPRDPVIHEVKALALFALGRYDESAAVLNALLASSPGMDWKSMSSLYDDEREYTDQMRRLETYVGDHPREAGPIFTLAYHYLVIGENESATRMLKAVVQRKPDDLTARRMLDALEPPTEVAVARPETVEAPADAPAVNLVGAWTAKSPDATVELVVQEDGGFSWSATPPGKPAVTVTGTISANEENLALESKDQGSMLGKVKTLGPNRFLFVMAGTPESDPGLTFERK